MKQIKKWSSNYINENYNNIDDHIKIHSCIAWEEGFEYAKRKILESASFCVETHPTLKFIVPIDVELLGESDV